MLHDGVAALAEVTLEELVLIVCGQGLLVARVGLLFLYLGNQILVKVHLADMRSGGVNDGTIGVRCGIGVQQDVDVVCAANVMTRKQGRELDCTICVSLLKAAQERAVPIGLVRWSRSILVRDYTSVHAGRVAFCTSQYPMQTAWKCPYYLRQTSTYFPTTGSQVLTSMNCTSRWRGTPAWSSTMFSLTLSPATSVKVVCQLSDSTSDSVTFMT